MPGLNTQAYYRAQSAALNVMEANLPDYAPAMATVNTPLTDSLKVPFTGVKINSPYVSRVPRMNGIRGVYGYGSVDMGRTTKGPISVDDGAVNIQLFQPLMKSLHFFSQNLKWYIAYPNGAAVFLGSNPVRYQYWSMRVPQIQVPTSGGPGPITTRMSPKPRWSQVQHVRRAIGRVKYFATQPAPGVVSPMNTAAGTIGRVPNAGQ